MKNAASFDAAFLFDEPDQHVSKLRLLDVARTRLLHDIKEFFKDNPTWDVDAQGD